MPSRFDIPDISEVVDTLEVAELCDAIEVYFVQLEQAIDNQEHSKMVSAGQVLVSLTRRRLDELADNAGRILAKAPGKVS